MEAGGTSGRAKPRQTGRRALANDQTVRHLPAPTPPGLRHLPGRQPPRANPGSSKACIQRRGCCGMRGVVRGKGAGTHHPALWTCFGLRKETVRVGGKKGEAEKKRGASKNGWWPRNEGCPHTAHPPPVGCRVALAGSRPHPLGAHHLSIRWALDWVTSVQGVRQGAPEPAANEGLGLPPPKKTPTRVGEEKTRVATRVTRVTRVM